MKKLTFILIALCLVACFSADVFAQRDMSDKQKTAYLNDCRNVAMEMAALSDKVNALSAKWAALGYTVGGPDEFTQADIDANSEYLNYPIASLQTLTGSTWAGFDTWLLTGHTTNIRGIMP